MIAIKKFPHNSSEGDNTALGLGYRNIYIILQPGCTGSVPVIDYT